MTECPAWQKRSKQLSVETLFARACVCAASEPQPQCQPSHYRQARRLRVQGEYLAWYQSFDKKEGVRGFEARDNRYDAVTGAGSTTDGEKALRSFLRARIAEEETPALKLAVDSPRNQKAVRFPRLEHLELLAVGLTAYDAGVIFGPWAFSRGGLVSSALTGTKNLSRLPKDIRRFIAVQLLVDGLRPLGDKLAIGPIDYPKAYALAGWDRAQRYADDLQAIGEALDAWIHSHSSERAKRQEDYEGKIIAYADSLEVYTAAQERILDEPEAETGPVRKGPGKRRAGMFGRREALPHLFVWREHSMLVLIRAHLPHDQFEEIPSFRLETKAAVWQRLGQEDEGILGSAKREAALFAGRELPLSSPGHAYMQMWFT